MNDARIRNLALIQLCACGLWLNAACQRGETPRGGTKGEGITVAVVALGPEDKPLDAGVAIYETRGTRKVVWEGRAGEKFRIHPGHYDVLIEYQGQRYWCRGEDLKAGDRVFKLPMATLTVLVRSSRGEVLSGEVGVYPPGARGDGPSLAEGRTSEPLPLLAGEYDVRVVVQGRERWRRGVIVEPGDDINELLVEPVGYLKAEVVDPAGEPVPAEVWVYAGDSPAHVPVAVGVTETPLALLPGRYDVTVRRAGFQDYAAGVAITANQTTVERFNYWLVEGK